MMASRPRTHRRWWLFCTAAAALFVSAAFTVLVTWRIANREIAYPADAVTYWSAESGAAWLYQLRPQRASMRLDGAAVMADARRGPLVLPVQAPPWWSRMKRPPTADDQRTIEEAFGWPWPALTASFSPADAQIARRTFSPWRLNRPHPQAPQLYMALPFRPLWPGLVANWLLTTAALWPLIAALARLPKWLITLLHWSRRRRGLCPRCTYDLQHALAGGCPECGWNRQIGASG